MFQHPHSVIHSSQHSSGWKTFLMSHLNLTCCSWSSFLLALFRGTWKRTGHRFLLKNPADMWWVKNTFSPCPPLLSCSELSELVNSGETLLNLYAQGNKIQLPSKIKVQQQHPCSGLSRKTLCLDSRFPNRTQHSLKSILFSFSGTHCVSRQRQWAAHTAAVVQVLNFPCRTRLAWKIVKPLGEVCVSPCVCLSVRRYGCPGRRADYAVFQLEAFMASFFQAQEAVPTATLTHCGTE